MTELFLLQPPPEMVVEIYVRHRKFHFLRGYCRSLVCAGGHVHFHDAFQRCSNPAMTTTWAEQVLLEYVALKELSIDVAPAQPWMRFIVPSQQGEKQ